MLMNCDLDASIFSFIRWSWVESLPVFVSLCGSPAGLKKRPESKFAVFEGLMFVSVCRFGMLLLEAAAVLVESSELFGLYLMLPLAESTKRFEMSLMFSLSSSW